MPTVIKALNIIGLLLITVGGIGSAMSTPAPGYRADGSVSLSPEQDKTKRIAMHHRQLRLPMLLRLIGYGALLQLIALLLPTE